MLAGARADDTCAAILAAIGTLQNMMEDFKKEKKQNSHHGQLRKIC